MPLQPPRTWIVGETVTAAMLNQEIRDQVNALIGDVDYVHKTADESVISSTTVQNDNHLLVSVAANAEYEIVTQLGVTGSAAGDIKTRWTIPSGATTQRFCRGPDTSSTGSTAATTIRCVALTNGHATEINYGLFSTSDLSWIEERMYVVVAGTAGVVQLQWAQNASTATNTTVKAGSYITVRRTA